MKPNSSNFPMISSPWLNALLLSSASLFLVACDPASQTPLRGAGPSTSSTSDGAARTTVPSESTVSSLQATDFIRMSDSELLDALKRGELTPNRNLANPEDLASISALHRIYTVGKKEGMYSSGIVRLLAASRKPGLAKEFLADFGQVPSITILPNAEQGWGTTAEMLQTPKYVLAESIIRMEDVETTARLWQQFPDMPVEDQMVVALVADQASGLSLLQPTLTATASAKNAAVSCALLDAANRLVARAFDEPASRDDARSFAKQLRDKGEARKFLLEKMR